MPQPLSDKDYVTFTRRWVWDTVENMSVDELKRFAIDALHEDMEEILQSQSQYNVLCAVCTCILLMETLASPI